MNKQIKKVVKWSVLSIIFIGLIIFIVFLFSNGEENQSQKNQSANQSSEGAEGNKVNNTGLAIFFSVLFLVIVAGLVIMTKRYPHIYKILNDEETKEFARKLLVERHKFPLQNKKGAVYFYYPYYFGGNKQFPRAIVGFNLDSDRTNIPPSLYKIIAVDVNRRNPKSDSALFPPTEFKELLSQLHDIKSGKTGESMSPLKQERQFISEAELEAIEGVRKEEIKERLQR